MKKSSEKIIRLNFKGNFKSMFNVIFAVKNQTIAKGIMIKFFFQIVPMTLINIA